MDSYRLTTVVRNGRRLSGRILKEATRMKWPMAPPRYTLVTVPSRGQAVIRRTRIGSGHRSTWAGAPTWIFLARSMIIDTTWWRGITQAHTHTQPNKPKTVAVPLSVSVRLRASSNVDSWPATALRLSTSNRRRPGSAGDLERAQLGSRNAPRTGAPLNHRVAIAAPMLLLLPPHTPPLRRRRHRREIEASSRPIDRIPLCNGVDRPVKWITAAIRKLATYWLSGASPALHCFCSLRRWWWGR